MEEYLLIRIILNWTGYLLFLAAVLFLTVFYHNYFLFLLVIITALLPILSAAVNAYLSRHIHAVLEITAMPVHKNNAATLTIHLNNPAPFPVLNCTIGIGVRNLYSTVTEDVLLNVPLMPCRDNTFHVPVTSCYAGCVRAGFTRLDFTGFLHLSRWHIKTNIPGNSDPPFCDLIVLPSLLKEFVLPDYSGGSGEDDYMESSRKGMASVPSEVTDIREYIPGDRLQQIHWKMSAKKDMLMVKEYVTVSSKDTVLLLELGLSADSTEPLLDLLYTAGMELLSQNRSYLLCWWSSSADEIRNQLVETSSDLTAAIAMIYYEVPYEEVHKAFTMSGHLREHGSFFYLSPCGHDASADYGTMIYYHKGQAALYQYTSR